MKSNLHAAANSGFIIVLLSRNYVESAYCMYELKEIMKLSKNAKIITLAIGECLVPEVLRKSKIYHIPLEPTKEDMHLVAELIEADVKYDIKGPISYQTDVLNKYNEIAEKINYEKRYHPLEAKLIQTYDENDNHLEVYEFPCCGKKIIVGEGPISRLRSDGCQKQEDK